MTLRISIGLLFLAALAGLAGCDKDKREQTSSRVSESGDKKHASGSHLERIKAAKVIRIGIKSDSPPFCFQDKEGNPQGFDVDIGFRLARALDVQPLFVTIKSSERIDRLKKGDVDVVIATLTATRRRAKEIDFSIPYYQDQQMLLVKASSPIQSYRDLSGKKIAVASNTTSIDNIKIVAPDAQVTAVDSVAAAFEKLSKDEVDGITGDGLQLQALKSGAADADKFRIAGEGFSAEPYVIGLPQNDSQLRSHIDEFLTELWNSGAWTRIFNKWLGAQSAYNLESHFQMPVLPP